MRPTIRPLITRLGVFSVIVLALGACSAAESPSASQDPTGPQTGLPSGTLTLESADGPTTLGVEIAETDTTRQIGLMGRTTLTPSAGMAFLFPEPHEGGFWMKNTLVPLSIAFWGTDQRIAAILDMEPCGADTCPPYDPGMAYAGAVEVNQGWFAEHGVGVGSRVELQR
jgi:uncharacterized membrane protein (UPF0127 family)